MIGLNCLVTALLRHTNTMTHNVQVWPASLPVKRFTGTIMCMCFYASLTYNIIRMKGMRQQPQLKQALIHLERYLLDNFNCYLLKYDSIVAPGDILEAVIFFSILLIQSLMALKTQNMHVRDCGIHWRNRAGLLTCSLLCQYQ